MTEPRIDIGHGVTIRWYCWAPNRDLNPQYAHLPDVEEFGLLIDHPTRGGETCLAAVAVDGPVQRELAGENGDKHLWKVENREPLTLSPSILCRCGFHGFIRNGKWVPA